MMKMSQALYATNARPFTAFSHVTHGGPRGRSWSEVAGSIPHVTVLCSCSIPASTLLLRTVGIINIVAILELGGVGMPPPAL